MINETRLIKWDFPDFCSEENCKKDHEEYYESNSNQKSRFHVYKGLDGRYIKENCYYLNSISTVGEIVIHGRVFFNQSTRLETAKLDEADVVVTSGGFPISTLHMEIFDKTDLYKAQIKAANLFLLQFVPIPQLGAIIADYCWGDSVMIFLAQGYKSSVCTEYKLILEDNAL